MEKSADVLLSDGTAVHMRQIGPDDAAAIVDLHSRLSDRTRYLRYFSPYPRIPERDLQRFVNVDHTDRELVELLPLQPAPVVPPREAGADRDPDDPLTLSS